MELELELEMERSICRIISRVDFIMHEASKVPGKGFGFVPCAPHSNVEAFCLAANPRRPGC